MGGRGSGNHYRGLLHGKKTVVEYCRSLSANRWMREGILQPRVLQFGSWKWMDAQTGETQSTIDYEVDTTDHNAPWLRLTYTFTQSREDIDYRVQLKTTYPHLGGRFPHRCRSDRRTQSGLSNNSIPCQLHPGAMNPCRYGFLGDAKRP
jgi:hypothetical protein